jgi:hypothetical protein
MAPEEFSEQAFDPIATHRFPQTAGHHQSQPGAADGGGGQNDPEVARVQPFAQGLRP